MRVKIILFISGLFGLCQANAQQNVGIGEIAPASKLTVKGNLSVGSAYSTTIAPANGAFIQGNVGIGSTNTPFQTLTITNAAGVYSNNEYGTSGLSIESGQTANTDMILYMGADKINNVGYIQSVKYGCCTGSLGLNARGGNVGIATQSPNQPLTVNGNAALWNSSQIMFYTDAGSTEKGFVGQVGSGDFELASSQSGQTLRIGTNNSSIAFFPDGSINSGYNPDVLITNIGRVGIGTQNPNNLLTVNGNQAIWNGNQIQFYSDAGSTQEGFIGQTGNSSCGMAVTGSGQELRIGTNNGPISFYTNGLISGSGNTSSVQISQQGYVGILGSPSFPLSVLGAKSTSIGGSSFGYLNNGGAGAGTSTTGGVGIYCAARILTTQEVDATSDRRIKKNISYPRPQDMLALANLLAVAHYNYIDRQGYNGKLKTGFIAQDLENILPDAVNQDPGYIPCIYAPAQALKLLGTSLQVTTTAAHGLVAGDKIRMYDKQNNEYEVPVADVVNQKVFAIANWAGPIDSLFIYGKEVNDLRNVDFDQITTVAIGAIQELDRKIEDIKNLINRLIDVNTGFKVERINGQGN